MDADSSESVVVTTCVSGLARQVFKDENRLVGGLSGRLEPSNMSTIQDFPEFENDYHYRRAADFGRPRFVSDSARINDMR